MTHRLLAFCLVLTLCFGTAAAQDARSVLQAAADAMGASDLRSIRYSGTGWRGAVGQSFRPDQDWPRFDLRHYTRTIDFEARSSKEEMVLVQGDNSPRGGGGTPIEGERKQTFLVSGDYAWNLEGNAVVPAPAAAELRQLEIWLTPHGFLKAALAGNPTAITRNEYGERVTVVSFTALGKYQVNGTITSDNLVARVQTWIPNPVVGDMYYENVYGNYRDFGGVKVPGVHQHQDVDDNERLPNVSGGDHSFGLNVTDVEVNVAGAALKVPAAVQDATVSPVHVESRELADGVWYLGGSSHNSMAVAFRDFAVVVEAPLNEERSLAVIDEVARLMPGKPIRFLVTTHHHWDHIGGMRAYVHEGATVITHDGNRPYYEELVIARRWIQKPDRLSLYPPEETAEGYTFETFRQKYVISDGSRNLDLHHVQGLSHSAGMVIAYLPEEKIVVEADLYSPSRDRPPATPNRSSRTFYDNIERLQLDIETIVPVHGPPVPMSDFMRFMGENRESSGAR
ncbi:MAG TPA: MBL fold metallo-hydrolase [Vicinamibacteria bacterium]|nr:MBL fold metallo-hydrolase [Vicinamibacteria bacterium]